MRKLSICVAVACLAFSGIASADTYREVWSCELKDGKTLEDVQAVNSKWLAWVRKKIDKDVSSAVLTAVVGELEGFMFVDTYPSLEAWSAAKDADDDEGSALEAEFDAVVECGENSLLRHRPTP